MLRLFVLASTLLLSTTTFASQWFVSPAFKLSDFRGGELQFGKANVGALDAVYLNAGLSTYQTDRFDEQVQFYRIGMMHRLTDQPHQGFQFEVGAARYKGEKFDSTAMPTSERFGVSIGGGYTHHITNHFGVRFGMDYSFFERQSTHLIGDSIFMFNVGVLGTF